MITNGAAARDYYLTAWPPGSQGMLDVEIAGVTRAVSLGP